VLLTGSAADGVPMQPPILKNRQILLLPVAIADMTASSGKLISFGSSKTFLVCFLVNFRPPSYNQPGSESLSAGESRLYTVELQWHPPVTASDECQRTKR